MYTIEEYQVLHKRLHEHVNQFYAGYNPISRLDEALVMYIDKFDSDEEIFFHTFIDGKDTPQAHRYFSDWLYTRSRAAFRLMYTTNILRVPLFINSADTILTETALWRLEIGK